MKTQRICTLAFLVLQAAPAGGQGTFVYDQQSSANESERLLYGGGANIFRNMPFGQSFTPSFDSVALVRLNMADGDPSGTGGATIYVNLRSDSMTGSILGTTDPLVLPNLFLGITNFVFSTPVQVTPGVQYYFDIVEQAGGPFGFLASSYNYPGGQAYHSGIPRQRPVVPRGHVCTRAVAGYPAGSRRLLLAARPALAALPRRSAALMRSADAGV